MRPPPMPAAALQQQQHESIHNHQQLRNQQHQESTTTATTTTTSANLAQKPQQRKSRFNQKEIIVENHLNFGCSTASSTVGSHSDQAATFASIVPNSPHTYQQQSQSRLCRINYKHVDDDSIQLVDLSNSPTLATLQHEFSRRPPVSYKTRSNSLISECAYSYSSSSEDGSYAGDRLLLQTRTSNIFDDPAEHFIINFPAADSPTHHRNDVVINLPLSETEPLLTNIEATVADTQRAICLSKNSASLIFTRKDLSTQQQRKQRNSCCYPATGNSNNNFVATHKRNSSSNIGATALTATSGQRRQHHSFKSADLSRKQQQQHLKEQQSTYTTPQQQHRHSLQLNYNNNLISNGNSGLSCAGSSSSNNNLCFSSSAGKSNCKRVVNPTPVSTGITAAVTRKQHAYSWYAPVYSALEEELEQDSRDSSPIHNLANTKKHNYPHRSVQNSTSADNETVALLETRNQINIQAQLHLQLNSNGRGGASGQTARRANSLAVAPTSLPLQNSANSATNIVADLANGAATSGSYNGEGPQASSLGLAGGPLPRLRRWENFVKSLFRPSNGRAVADDAAHSIAATASPESASQSPFNLQLPASPEITITRTPSEQNLVVMRDPAGRCHEHSSCTNDKLANGWIQGSTSSLNVVQQKLWNMMRREGSATSLNQEKSHSIVQYTGLRKCETVLALTRQSSSVCSPVLGAGPGIIGGAATHHMGSGIFNENGIEQIRPLNRLRNSVSNMNATCSRCSSLLSLAASGSRYSLNTAANGGAGCFVSTIPSGTSTSQYQLQAPQHQNPSYLSNSNLSSINNRSSNDVTDTVTGTGCPTVSMGPSVIARNSSSSGNGSRKSSAGANSSYSASCSISPPSNMSTATFTPSISNTPTTPNSNTSAIQTNIADLADNFAEPAATKPATAKQPITVTSLLSMSASSSSASLSEEDAAANNATAVSVAVPPSSSSSARSSVSSTSLRSRMSKHQRRQQKLKRNQQPQPLSLAAVVPSPVKPFEMFTCKLCLIDVEDAEEATTLLQCGCQFCTECMKAYVEFEISEGAYEISCPDALCPAQGILTLPEIANLTPANLMKKHHRYRLNREIELDKSRTWCPRAGCETVCLVGPRSHTADTAPSTSTSTSHSAAQSLTSPGSVKEGGTDAGTQLLCAVQCPSCKDEFCSACKKVWHPTTSCEENSRRLVADGQDDIGIPFDNDLIKCCPMCAVPIEKDEGCAQMMCKRCKHVFCWYCLASLDDDFLLRHYDKGPCKNKLGHSRASVVWHRAQVIGIFAGFGILLLVASPLLLLAAPCIICCKCRICSGSKVDEGDGELDEATALQS